MKTITIQINEETYKAFKVVLAKNGEKMASVLRRIIEAYTKRHEEEK